jgi:hypothetical protein
MASRVELSSPSSSALSTGASCDDWGTDWKAVTCAGAGAGVGLGRRLGCSCSRHAQDHTCA